MLVHNTLTVLPFVVLAYGGPLIGRNPRTCDTGPIQCCNMVQSPSSPVAAVLLPLLNLSGIGDGPIGLQCTSLTGAGSAGKCESNPVCCNKTHFNGLVNVGCSPIDLL